MKQLIYIAEDEKNIRETLQRFLENDGYEVCAFETGDALLGVFLKTRRYCYFGYYDAGHRRTYLLSPHSGKG